MTPGDEEEDVIRAALDRARKLRGDNDPAVLTGYIVVASYATTDDTLTRYLFHEPARQPLHHSLGFVAIASDFLDGTTTEDDETG